MEEKNAISELLGSRIQQRLTLCEGKVAAISWRLPAWLLL